MKPLPQISEAEFEVMKVIWEHAPISTNEITEKLTQTTAWSPKTIQTLIKRLVTKGALSYEKHNRDFPSGRADVEALSHRPDAVSSVVSAARGSCSPVYLL